jgi:hypothetical protein
MLVQETAVADDQYPPDTRVRVFVEFDVGGTLTDPTTVQLDVRDPNGGITTYTYAGAQVTKDAVGKYHKDIVPSTPGRWFYKFRGDGDCEATDESSFRVRDDQIA